MCVKFKILNQNFIPTNNLTLDALTKDITANAIYYNLKEKKLEDPLDGMGDLRKGIIVTPLKNKPLKNDFFRTFRIFKTSADLSLKLSDNVENYIGENRDLIKVNI